MKNDFLTLVEKTYTKDNNGVNRPTEALKINIPCQVKSAGASEWFEGGRNGLNPSYTFIIRKIEYSGEETVIYNGDRHYVYRTYERGDVVELHVQKEKGV